MKKLLTLALAIVALTAFAGLAVGQEQKVTGKVLSVNAGNKTFKVEVTFSAKAIPLPKKEEKVDVIYAPNPTGGPLEVTTIKGTKSNASERVVPGQSTARQSKVTGKVLQVNSKNNTFILEVTFSAKNLKDPLPEAGKIYAITFTGSTTLGGPLEAHSINGTRSNTF